MLYKGSYELMHCRITIGMLQLHKHCQTLSLSFHVFALPRGSEQDVGRYFCLLEPDDLSEL